MGSPHVAREDVLRRYAPPARDRARAAAHAEGVVPGRADARARPAEPQPALDAREAPERRGRRHGVLDDALHGRGGEDGAARGDHRSRPHRRAGHRARVARANRWRVARGRVLEAHGHDDSRRAQHERRSDAANGEDVGRRPAMNVIFMLWLREIKRYSRSRAQIIGSLAQPALYLLVLGFGFGSVFQQAGQGSYLQFMAPGVIAMGILFTSIFSGIGLLWDRQFGFL